jgi:hypothetical protein
MTACWMSLKSTKSEVGVRGRCLKRRIGKAWHRSSTPGAARVVGVDVPVQNEAPPQRWTDV